jgi:predicted metal-binding protein
VDVVGSNPTVGSILIKQMQRVHPKWLQSGLVLVCERCSKERIPEEDPEIAAQIGDFHLRNWLKERLKADGRWGAIRAISASCMDVCARGRVTVCIEPQVGATTVLVVDPIAEREALYEAIVELLGSTATK